MDPLALDNLPTDVLAEIATRLPPRSICRLAAVCRATAAAVAGPPSVWELLLPQSLRAAAAAAATAAGTAAPTAAAAAVAATSSPSGLPISYAADGAAAALVVFLADGGAAAPAPRVAWPPPPPPPAADRAAGAPAWRVALPVAAAAVSWGHVREYWAVLPGGGPAGRDALALRGVWWFDVAVTAAAAALPGRDYEVALEMVAPHTAGGGAGWDDGMAGVQVVVLPLPPPVAAPRAAGGGAPPPPPPPPQPPSASRGGARHSSRPQPRARRELAGARGRLEALAASAEAAAAAALRDAGDGGGDGGDDVGGGDGGARGDCVGGGDRSGRDATVSRPAVLADGAALRPWLRVVLAPQLRVEAGGGVRVQLVCHNVATRKAGAVFGDVWLTPLERGEG